MITVLLSWIILFGATAGIGFIVLQSLSCLSKWINNRHLNVFQLFWIGTTATVAIAHYLHFFFPLNALFLALWLIAGMVGLLVFVTSFLITRRSGCESFRSGASVRLALFMILLLVSAYKGASGAAQVRWSGAYDTDLYHFQVIRWLNEYPIVRGLGNLHSRLAHTSAFLTYSSLVDNLWWDRRSAWITYGLFVSVACAQWLWAIVVGSAQQKRRVTVFCIATFAYILKLQSTIHPTLYFDEIALLVQFVLVYELLVGFDPDDPRDPFQKSFTWTRITLVLILAALGFSVKPIGAVSLIFTILIATYFAIITFLRDGSSLLTKCVAICCAGSTPGILLLSHVIRNLIMTGWLLYPAPVGPVRVDWAMPRDPQGSSHWHEMQSVEGQYKIIKAWARLPGPDYYKALSGNYSAWFSAWKDRVWNGIEPRWLYIGLLFCLMHIGRLALSRKARQSLAFDLVMITLSATNIIYWFVTAPDMRFGRAFFWIWMGVCTTLFLDGISKRKSLPFIVAFALFIYAVRSLSIQLIPQKPPDILGKLGKATSRPVELVTIQNGQYPPLQVYVPVSDDRTGDSPIPATPYPLTNLLMRNPGVLRDGFKVNQNNGKH